MNAQPRDTDWRVENRSPWPPPCQATSVVDEGIDPAGVWERGPRSPKQSSMLAVGLIVAVVGWAIFGFTVLVGFFSGEETNCTANRGQAYQDCVRDSDLTGLRIQGLVMGLAMIAIVMVLIGLVRRQGTDQPVMRRNALAASASLVLASITGWTFGAITLWAPDRPFPYEPVSTTEAHTILATGGLIGIVVGVATSLGVILLNRRGQAR